MFFEVLFFISIGIAFGVLTGLVPGLHPNTVFTLMLSTIIILHDLEPIFIVAFIVSVAISNTFTDFIPSIIFGAPDPSTALSVLPGHKMLLAGRGQEALFLTVIGGLGVSLLTLLTLPLLLYIIPLIYSVINPHIHLILIIIVLWMFYTEKGFARIPSVVVFSLSGLLGVVVLTSLPSDLTLFPALTGLFGLSALVSSIWMKARIPPQEEVRSLRGDHRKPVIAGWLSGMFSGLLPGIGAVQAGIIVAQIFRSKTREFLTALGGINTANMFFTLVVFYTLGKTRSGAVAAISHVIDSLSINNMLVMVAAGILTAFVASAITLKIGRFSLQRVRNVEYKKMSLAIITMLLLLVVIISGPLGLLVSVTGMFTGLFCILSGSRRTHLMGFLLLPTILFFSGTGFYIM
jgi:putative membrane protein